MDQANDDAKFGYNRIEDGKRQLAAGIALLGESGLLRRSEAGSKFVPVHESSFETKAVALHPRFGRVMLWVLFSTGSEYLLKGALIVSGHFTPIPTSKASLSENDVLWTDAWFKTMISKKFELAPALHYVTLSDGTLDGALKQLCGTHAHADMVRAAFKLLAEGIRNRDAHAYVKNVRASHHFLIHHLAEAYSALLSWLDPDIVSAAVEIASMSRDLPDES